MVTCIVFLYKNKDIQHYTSEIANFVTLSKEHSLVINIRKTKEIILQPLTYHD